MPQFIVGENKTAVVEVSNPTASGFDYNAVLYLGITQVAADAVAFHLNAGETKQISFSITMPAVVGTYPVYLSVLSGGELVGLYQATEDVVLIYDPAFDPWRYDLDGDGYINTVERYTAYLQYHGGFITGAQYNQVLALPGVRGDFLLHVIPVQVNVVIDPVKDPAYPHYGFYDAGEVVTLTGYSGVGEIVWAWEGLESRDNPLIITMNRDRRISCRKA